MSTIIEFTIRAVDEAAFRAAWIAAGIIEDAPGYQFRAPYPGVEITAAQGWSGEIEGVPGWHANARVEGPLVAVMTEGLEQYDENGNLLPVMDRTWAAYVFGLTEGQDIDLDSGFPYLAETAAGNVQYGDPRDIATPANVRQ